MFSRVLWKTGGASLPLADTASDEVGESGTAFGRDEAPWSGLKDGGGALGMTSENA